MILARPRPVPVLLFILGVIAFYVSLIAWADINAHAQGIDPAPVVERVIAVQSAPAAAADPPTDPIAVIGALLGGLALLIAGGHAIAALIAPRTKNTVDDKVRDVLAEVLAVIRGLPIPVPTTSRPAVPSTVNVLNVEVDPPTNPRSGGGGAVLLLALVLGVASLTSACSGTAGARGANAAGAFIDCQSPDLDAALLAEAIGVSKSALMKWISGSGDVDPSGLKAEAAPLKSNLMRCAFEAAIAAVATPAVKQPGAAMAAGLEVDGAALRARYAQVKVELGWPEIRAVR